MRIQLFSAVIAGALALAACANSGGLHPDGTRIDPASLKMQRRLADVPLSPAQWPKADWWTSLNDAQLNALIAEALQSSPTLADADARARLAQAEAEAADSAREPELNAGGRVGEARLPTTLPLTHTGHNKAAKYLGASFAWDLDLWGGQRAAWEAAVGLQRAAEIDAQAARIEISSAVARAYVQLGYGYSQQDVALAELRRATEVRALTQQRVAAGIDNALQLKQSESEVASAQGKKAQADRAIDAAHSALAVLLGKGPDRGLEITRPQPLPSSTLGLPSDLQVELLGHRADLVAARWRVEASDEDIKWAKTQFLPNINIRALAGLFAAGGGPLFEPTSIVYGVSPALSVPIFDGGRRRARLNAKDAAYDLVVARYNEILVRAVTEVSDDRDALDSLRIQIEAQQRALDAASGAWTLAEQRFRGGIGSYLEALSVRQQLLAAEQRMAELLALQSDFSVQMIRALGGGFEPTSNNR